MIRINVTNIQRMNRAAMLRYAEKLDGRYAQHVRDLARELQIPTTGRSKAQLIDAIAALLADGDYPQVVIKWNLA